MILVWSFEFVAQSESYLQDERDGRNDEFRMYDGEIGFSSALARLLSTPNHGLL